MTIFGKPLRWYIPMRLKEHFAGHAKTCKRCGQKHWRMYSFVGNDMWYQCVEPINDEFCSCHRQVPERLRKSVFQDIFRGHVKELVAERESELKLRHLKNES